MSNNKYRNKYKRKYTKIRNTKEKEYRACNTSAECTERW